jgi:hypothetical protein
MSRLDRRQLLLTGVIVLLLSMAAWSGIRGWISNVVAAAIVSEQQLAETGPHNSTTDAADLEHLLSAAGVVEGGGAEAALLLGRLYQSQALALSPWLMEAAARRSQAATAYREAAVMRPSWGLAWAQLAVIKSYEPDLDREFYHALERAMIVGAWEPAVQDLVLWVGMRTWARLTPVLQEQVKTVISRVLQHYPRDRYAVRTAVELHWEADIASMLVRDEQRRWLSDALLARARRASAVGAP